MKKTLLLATTAFFGFTASSQYVIEASSIPVIGDEMIQITDTLPNAGVSAGEAGVDKIYDLSDINISEETTQTFQDPSNFPGNEDFPNAVIAAGTDGGNAFFNTAQGQMELLGLSLDPGTGETFTIVYSDPQLLIKTPVTYDEGFIDSWYGSGTFYFGQEVQGFQVDSVRFTNDGERDVLYDGTGQLKTLAGTFNNVLRERDATTETTIIEACINPGIPGFPCQWQEFQNTTETTVTYTFYGAQDKMPLASITYNENESQVLEVTNNSDPELATGIFENNNQVTYNGVYPNPATSVVTFKNEVSAAKAVAINGIEIALEVNNNKASIANLANGSYTIIATNKNGNVSRLPLVVAK